MQLTKKASSEDNLAKSKEQPLLTEPLAPQNETPSPVCSNHSRFRIERYSSMKSLFPSLPTIPITERRVVYFTCPTTSAPYDITILSLWSFFFCIGYLCISKRCKKDVFHVCIPVFSPRIAYTQRSKYKFLPHSIKSTLTKFTTIIKDYSAKCQSPNSTDITKYKELEI